MTKSSKPRPQADSQSSERRERQPHRSGQEYEYGETPETGLGDAGVGADPSRQNARHAPRSAPHIDPELEDEEELRREPTPLQEGMRTRNG